MYRRTYLTINRQNGRQTDGQLNRYNYNCISNRQVDEVIDWRKVGRIYRISPIFARFKIVSRFRVSSRLDLA